MRQLIIFLSIICSSALLTFGQNPKDCSIIGGTTDTVICGDKKMIVELSFCESTRLYQDGVVTDIHGKEEFCFFYTYDDKKNLRKIEFWTFRWKNGGYVTKDKIGVLKILGAEQKLSVKRGFTLNHEFVKLVTKTL